MRVIFIPKMPAGCKYSEKEIWSMSTEQIPYKIYLSENEMPTSWYNVRADMKNKPAPLLNPGTDQPMGFDDLRRRFL